MCTCLDGFIKHTYQGQGHGWDHGGGVKMLYSDLRVLVKYHWLGSDRISFKRKDLQGSETILVSVFYEPVLLQSSIYEPVLLHSSIYEPVLLHSSIYEPVLLHSSIYEPVLLHSSIYEPVLLQSSIYAVVCTSMGHDWLPRDSKCPLPSTE